MERNKSVRGSRVQGWRYTARSRDGGNTAPVYGTLVPRTEKLRVGQHCRRHPVAVHTGEHGNDTAIEGSCRRETESQTNQVLMRFDVTTKYTRRLL